MMLYQKELLTHNSFVKAFQEFGAERDLNPEIMKNQPRERNKYSGNKAKESVQILDDSVRKWDLSYVNCKIYVILSKSCFREIMKK